MFLADKLKTVPVIRPGLDALPAPLSYPFILALHAPKVNPPPLLALVVFPVKAQARHHIQSTVIRIANLDDSQGAIFVACAEHERAGMTSEQGLASRRWHAVQALGDGR